MDEDSTKQVEPSRASADDSTKEHERRVSFRSRVLGLVVAMSIPLVLAYLGTVASTRTPPPTRIGTLEVHRREVDTDDAMDGVIHLGAPIADLKDAQGNVVWDGIRNWQEVGPSRDALVVVRESELRAFDPATGRQIPISVQGVDGGPIGRDHRCANDRWLAGLTRVMGRDRVVLAECDVATSDGRAEGWAVLRYDGGRVVVDSLSTLTAQATGRRHDGDAPLRLGERMDVDPLSQDVPPVQVFVETEVPEQCPSALPDAGAGAETCERMAYLVDWNTRAIRGLPVPISIDSSRLEWRSCDGIVTPIVSASIYGDGSCSLHDAWPTTELGENASYAVKASWVELGTLRWP